MALVLPVLLLILFAVIDMGRLLQQQIQLTEAAREGARLGALNGTADQVKLKVLSIVGTGVVLSYPTGGLSVCAAAAQVGADSVVRVERPFRPATPLATLVTSWTPVTIRAVGVMSCVG